MHTINEGQKDVYKAEGIKKVKWYAAEDERMCDVCGKMHDKEYDIDNVPSIAHANCRCTIIPIINTDLTNTVDNLKKSDIIIHKSLGASGKNYPVRLPDGNYTKFAEGTKITKIKVFAGKGTDISIRNAVYLEAEYGISSSEWQKVRGEGKIMYKGKPRKAELHWYEANNKRKKMKVKRFLDES